MNAQLSEQQYIFGISEIDHQHNEIEMLLMALRTMIDEGAHHGAIRGTISRLHKVLVQHFSVEEAVMHVFSRPETERHCRVHQEILQQLESIRRQVLSNTFTDIPLRDAIKRVVSQIYAHDIGLMNFIGTLKTLLDTDAPHSPPSLRREPQEHRRPMYS